MLLQNKIALLAVACLLIGYVLLPINTLLEQPLSMVLEDEEGQLLSASVAADGQWRFGPPDTIPERFVICLTTFEDKRFFSHLGVDPMAIVRAFIQNIKAGEVVSGGSTLTMQTIRLARQNPPRTFFQKIWEIVWATRLEWSLSKQEILKTYCAYAPFGGNVVGLDAAAWRYYGRPTETLSWGQMATLAVLPNAPALIYPGKNSPKLLQKRNRLLTKLWQNGHLDSLSCVLAQAEPLPAKPIPLPRLAAHLCDRLKNQSYTPGRYKTSLNYGFQQAVSQLVNKHQRNLEGNRIFHASALVTEVSTGKVLAYVGNVSDRLGPGRQVDMITALRSYGSLLKPVLYAAMLNEGLLMPDAWVKDVPVSFGGFRPRNFDKTFDGLVPASEALYRSLNIPAVNLLQEYGTVRFLNILHKNGFKHINKSAGHYGLSLILGGAEASMQEVSHLYTNWSRLLRLQSARPVFSFSKVLLPGSLWQSEADVFMGPAAIWQTTEALTKGRRPAGYSFGKRQKIAWKTGTSYGLRDSWAVGFTPEYVVVVWVGNADGEGRPGLTGLTTAAPLMFDIFNILPETENWFSAPASEMNRITVCQESGWPAGSYCPAEEQLIASRSHGSLPCAYHQPVHLDSSGQLRVSAACVPVPSIKTQNRLVLPPIEAYYYKKSHPLYKSLPAWKAGCEPLEQNEFSIIYPKHEAIIYLPKIADKQRSSLVLHAAHADNKSVLYWHLDNQYIGYTEDEHKIPVQATQGKHVLTLLDSKGNSRSCSFTVKNEIAKI